MINVIEELGTKILPAIQGEYKVILQILNDLLHMTVLIHVAPAR